MRKKLLSIGALVLSASIALTGCSSSGSSKTTDSNAKGSGTLTVWVDQNREASIKAIADQFQKDTGVTLNVVVKQFEDMKKDAVAQIPTGKGPDVFIGANDWTGSLAKNGTIQPVELGSKKADFLPVAVSAFTYEGKTYGVPIQIENLALVRNTQLAPNAPGSWDELVKTGNELVAAGKASMPIAIQQGEKGDAYHMFPLQASYGAQVFALNADGTYDPKTLAMCGSEGAAFAAAIKTMAEAKTLNSDLTSDVAKDQFAQGKVPYTISGPWNLDTFQKGAIGTNYSIESVPSAGGKNATPFVGVQGFYVSAKTQQQLAATKFIIDYMGSQDIQTKFYQTAKRAPANQKAYDAAKSDKDVAAFGAIGASGVAMPNVPAMEFVWTYWGNTELAIMKGAEADPAAAWTKMCEAIKKDMG